MVEARQRQNPFPFEPVSWAAIEDGLALQRIVDLIVACAVLILFLPLMLLVAVAILLDSGAPVFFRQERVGRHRQPIYLYKFRSMRRDADEEIHRQHTLRAVNGYTVLRLPEDPRITRVGKIIRRWSIDELPNLINVIKGDMSMVGPRPLVPYEAAAICEGHSLRFAVRPGITGLAQVAGRLDLTHEERLDLNVHYVLNRSVWTDLAIMAKTVPTVFARRG